MNDINEIIDLIKQNGGNATVDEVVSLYCKKHRMIKQPNYRTLVETTLKSSKSMWVYYNPAIHKWCVSQFMPKEFPNVTDNKSFHQVHSSKHTIVCRLTYMKFYDGISEEDMPVNGGSFVADNNDAFEKMNFHEYDDGYCYGFIETKYKKGHKGENAFANTIVLENIDAAYKNQESVSGIRVVFVAFSPLLKKTVVVGWYDNATVFRHRKVKNNLIYMVKCCHSDAHLIPHTSRSFEIPKASPTSYGIGQSNFWYIQRVEAAKELETELQTYIDNYGY